MRRRRSSFAPSRYFVFWRVDDQPSTVVSLQPVISPGSGPAAGGLQFSLSAKWDKIDLGVSYEKIGCNEGLESEA
jgi:hypothetical protein